MAQTVIGIFDNAEDAQKAVQQLVDNGFSRNNIDVSARSSNTGNTSGSGLASGSEGSGYNTASSSNPGINTGSSTDAFTTGSSTDAGYNTGSPTNTGYMSGDALNSGFNTGSSTGLGSSAGTFGSDFNSSRSTAGEHKESGISRFFKSLFGGDDDQVNRYANVAERSGSIVTVHAETSEQAEEAADILDDAGAVDVDEKASQYGYGYDSKNTGSPAKADFNTAEGTTSIPIIEEQLEVGKKTVERGGVRLKSRIVERQVEENLRLREERVWVERNSVDRPATESDFQNFKEGTVELTEQAEVPVVSKQARVVEEVSLGKEVDEKDETVRGTVRNTEVDVENLKSDKRKGYTDSDDWKDSKSSL